jgi:hypothetical protein
MVDIAEKDESEKESDTLMIDIEKPKLGKHKWGLYW